MKYEQHEFEHNELYSYSFEIWKRTSELIRQVIKEKSLLQVGDIAEISHVGEFVKAKIYKVELCVVSSFTPNKYSFRYEAMLLNKKGEIIKGRKPVWFGAWKIGDKLYSSPSYYRKKIIPATFEGEKF